MIEGLATLAVVFVLWACAMVALFAAAFIVGLPFTAARAVRSKIRGW